MKFTSISLIIVFIFSIKVSVKAQDPSAITEFESTEQGILIPRMSTDQRNNILTPADGLLVYDMDINVFYFYTTTNGWTSLEASEKLTSLSLSGDGQSIDYIDEDNNTNNINLCSIVGNCESVTSLNYNSMTKELSYTDENNSSSNISLTDLVSSMTDSNNGKTIATHTSGDGTLTNIEETITTLTDNNDGTYTYTSENGTTTLISAGGGSSKSVIGTSIFPSGATFYAGPFTNNNNSVESDAAYPMPAGTISELRVYSPGTSDNTLTVTVIRNGAPTSVTCSITAGQNTCDDLTNSQAFTAGDLLSFRLERPGSTPGKYLRVTTVWEAN